MLNETNLNFVFSNRLESASCAVYDHSKTYTPEETINDDSNNMDIVEAQSNMNESDNMETIEALAQESTQANNDPDFTPPKKRRITRKPGKKNQKEKIKKIKKNHVKPSKKELTGRRKNGQNKEINIDKGGKVYSVTCGDQKGQFYLDKFSSGNCFILLFIFIY